MSKKQYQILSYVLFVIIAAGVFFFYTIPSNNTEKLEEDAFKFGSMYTLYEIQNGNLRGHETLGEAADIAWLKYKQEIR